MKRVWQLQEAKNRFSELVDRAIEEGPQTVSRSGKNVVVVLSIAEYARDEKKTTSLVDFFRVSPLRGVALDIRRSRERGRKVAL